jgi:propanol-preferring alcohol dehydrogenase
MKAALYHEKAKELKIESIPDPKAPQGWALVKVRAAGVCGTELHFLEGILGPAKYPFILGHEIAGEVTEAPKGSNWKAGDKVCIYNKMNCGKCRNCRTGFDELCSSPLGQIGFSHDGGFAEYVVAPENSLVSLPKELSFADGAVLSCAGISARHAVRLSKIGMLDTVVVDGVGGVGLMVAQVAKLSGARVLAIADSKQKAELMQQVGIEESIVIDSYEGLSKKILDKTGGKGVDAFFELVGTKDSAREGLLSLGDLGRFVIIGYTKDHIDLDPIWMVIGERKMLASVQGAKRDLEDVLELASKGKIQTVIQNKFPLENVNDALKALRERKSLGRNVIVF